MKLKSKIIKEENPSPKRDWIADRITKPFIISCIIGVFMVLLINGIKVHTYVIRTDNEFRILTPRLYVLQFGERLNKKLEIFDDTNKESITEEATELIISFEGFSSTCYEDGKGYSHGFGHKCLGGLISEDSSKNILKREAKRLYNKIEPLYPFASKDRLVGLISYTYNTPLKQPAINNKSFIEAVNANDKYFIKGYMDSYSSFYRGLVIRRENELSLIF